MGHITTQNVAPADLDILDARRGDLITYSSVGASRSSTVYEDGRKYFTLVYDGSTWYTERARWHQTYIGIYVVSFIAYFVIFSNAYELFPTWLVYGVLFSLVFALLSYLRPARRLITSAKLKRIVRHDLDKGAFPTLLWIHQDERALPRDGVGRMRFPENRHSASR